MVPWTGRSWNTGDENAAQVKRLISRDKKEFLGNSTDILDKYNTEFGDGNVSASSTPDISAGACSSRQCGARCKCTEREHTVDSDSKGSHAS